jgi:hypothetical protein
VHPLSKDGPCHSRRCWLLLLLLLARGLPRVQLRLLLCKLPLLLLLRVAAAGTACSTAVAFCQFTCEALRDPHSH